MTSLRPRGPVTRLSPDAKQAAELGELGSCPHAKLNGALVPLVLCACVILREKAGYYETVMLRNVVT